MSPFRFSGSGRSPPTATWDLHGPVTTVERPGDFDQAFAGGRPIVSQVTPASAVRSSSGLKPPAMAPYHAWLESSIRSEPGSGWITAMLRVGVQVLPPSALVDQGPEPIHHQVFASE